MSQKYAIEVENLTKIFKSPGNREGNTILTDISFKIPYGASVAVTGENGSGKTTLLKVLATLYLPDGGMNRILGWDLVRDASMIREKISFVSPGLDFQRKLTLEENLKFFAKVQNSEIEGALKFLEAMKLMSKIDERTETFSEGQKAITRLAIGFMKDSEILYLDEVTTGLDVNRREEVINYIESELTRKTKIIVDHNSSVIDRLCDQVLILKRGGRVHKIINIKELLESLPYAYEITAIPKRTLSDREIKQLWPRYEKTGGIIRFYPKSRTEAQVINTRILSSGFISRAETRAIDLNDYSMRMVDDESNPFD
ncbi:MAG: Daunorubicin/doxorubicin resistance ATP-binding protein DrrA [Candidatus Heimdallarchaeota archaeon LC_2]|nr:MAG: Daunorubicin/doxorubicin resistance ATP-binding protein DrrA [Candidatus Heimdallarchaeota archaeon LC_2]